MPIEPTSLQKEVEAVAEIAAELGIRLESGLLEALGEGENEYVYTSATEVSLELPDADDAVELPLADVVRILSETRDAEFLDSQYRTRGQVLERVEPANARAFHYLYLSSDRVRPLERLLPAELNVDGKAVSLGLAVGFTPFALGVVGEGMHDKYNPPYSHSESFVDARFEQGMDLGVVNDAIRTYIYSLSADLDLDFRTAPVADAEGWLPGEDEEETIKSLEVARRRPLKLGPGVGHLLSLYGAAISHGDDPQYAFTSYAKVIEYVSATVVWMASNNAIRQKLLSSAALDPDATYIADLTSLVESLRNYKKDSEALRLTLETCCDVVEIAPLAPKRLTELRPPKGKSLDGSAALVSLAARITATRNQLSHAKANYQLTGQEYPLDDLEEFIPCVRVVAQQVIRWFLSSDPALRVI